MRSFTSLVVVVVATLSLSSTAHAQDWVEVEEEAAVKSERLTAEVFIAASFPDEIVAAAQKADKIAARTQEGRIKAQCRLEEAEAVYDWVLRHPEIPVKLFVPVYEEYVNAIQAFWDIDNELKAADAFVMSLYFSWIMSDVESDTDYNSAEVFQKWQEATRIAYVNVSDDEEDMYRTMLNMGQYRMRHDRRKIGVSSLVLECKLET